MASKIGPSEPHRPVFQAAPSKAPLPETKEKKDMFVHLVQAFNAIPGMQPINLASRNVDLQKDALAFVVEHCPLTEKEAWQAVMNQLIINLGHLEPLKATYLIDDSVQLACQNAVSHKIEALQSMKSPQAEQEIFKWQTWLKMYNKLCQFNKQKRDQNLPIRFDGVPRELLPPWYIEDHGIKS